mmetsp:Transcript_22807/g.65082  ORF Transcript_22807/g.65082 Transcript_22807/m.65082 type:complete len:100 (+) Transcript_22807:2870-3169(+)
MHICFAVPWDFVINPNCNATVRTFCTSYHDAYFSIGHMNSLYYKIYQTILLRASILLLKYYFISYRINNTTQLCPCIYLRVICLIIWDLLQLVRRRYIQ